MRQLLDGAAHNVLFNEARTHSSFTDRSVEGSTLAVAWNLAHEGPASANSSPCRIAFVKSPDAKRRLEPAL